MTTIAYIANQFPSPVEPYVIDEIRELRRRGLHVIPCSVRTAVSDLNPELEDINTETLFLQPVKARQVLQAIWLCLRQLPQLANFIHHTTVQGREPFSRRLRAFLHTGLGAYYALSLRGYGVEHIHAHHGYFSSWVAMVAARLLGIGFSFTLHGSDLLLHPAWLNLKLKHCDFCVTISEFNRRHILANYPEIAPDKILVQHLGVHVRAAANYIPATNRRFTVLAVGRLHPVKDHGFLLRACNEITSHGIPLCCWIAGEGPEREALQQKIFDLNLCGSVHLLGHLSPSQLDVCYNNADLIVLTSRSEGIPLTLMEAMVRGKPVLAPAISGIPELIRDGITGFLYDPGSRDDFIRKTEWIRTNLANLGDVSEAARRFVADHFDRDKNLHQFSDKFLHQIARRHLNPQEEATSHAHTLLQQI